MEILEDRRDGVLVVAPAGRVDSTSSGELEARLDTLLSTGDRRLVVDFAHVDYISSAGLRVMLLLAKKLREGGGALALCSIGQVVRMTFELAGFLSIFDVASTRDEALARFADRR
jgi:anti-anti-sigma factor